MGQFTALRARSGIGCSDSHQVEGSSCSLRQIIVVVVVVVAVHVDLEVAGRTASGRRPGRKERMEALQVQ